MCEIIRARSDMCELGSWKCLPLECVSKNNDFLSQIWVTDRKASSQIVQRRLHRCVEPHRKTTQISVPLQLRFCAKPGNSHFLSVDTITETNRIYQLSSGCGFKFHSCMVVGSDGFDFWKRVGDISNLAKLISLSESFVHVQLWIIYEIWRASCEF